MNYIIFARTPQWGKVKTRLATTLGEETTLRLYEAMLTDTLSAMRQRNADNVIIFAYPPNTTSEIIGWIQSRNLNFLGLRILPQEGSNLGEQMLYAFRRINSEFGLPAIILGTDSPTVSQDIWNEAELVLEEGNTAVLGRAEDGGFYTMGLPATDESLFFGDEYGTDTVFERTRIALENIFDRVHLLPEQSDIDDFLSLRSILNDITQNGNQTEYELVKIARQYGLVF